MSPRRGGRCLRHPPSGAPRSAPLPPRGDDEGGGRRPLDDQPVGAAGPEPLGPWHGAEEPHGCSSGRHLQSGWEEHGPAGSPGVGRGADCADTHHLLFKDPRHTLSSEGMSSSLRKRVDRVPGNVWLIS